MEADYQRPGWFTKYVFNPIVAGLTRAGVSLAGSRVLEVRGRKSGEWRRTPANPLEHEGGRALGGRGGAARRARVTPLEHGGERYLVAPRGETQWVRNLRASNDGRLRKGLRTEKFT